MIRALLLRALSLFPHFTIRRHGEPYLTRFWLLGGSTRTTAHPFLPFNLFLHVIHQSDDPPAHNHPWGWARSLILYGRYWETRFVDCLGIDYPLGREYGPGSVNAIGDETFHYLTLLTAEVWSLFLCGRKTKAWGFRDHDGFVLAADHVARTPGHTSNN